MPGSPVVLVHGFASSFDHGWTRHGWPELLADAGREVVGVELLGHGSSERPHDPTAYDGLVDHAAKQLPRGEVDIVGFSLGALTSLRLATAEPDRLGRIVVMGIGDGSMTPGGATDLADVISAEEPDPEIGGDELVFRRLAHQSGNDPEALSALLRWPQPPLDADALARVTCPVLVVIGDRDPGYPATTLAASFPDATLHVAPGVDHFSTPGDFSVIETVLDFLDG